ncbi:MAG: chemotaxis protein CheD [Acidobacteriota bacterium]
MIENGRPGDQSPFIGARAAHYLLPGFLHIGEATTITTILGSCVAVCIWDASRRTGGMNHFLLPRGTASRGLEGRFGEQAIPHLLKQLVESGAERGRLQAKVFGGACVNAAFQRPDHLGLKNAQAALQFLAVAGVRVVSQDVGGTRGRKLLFHTDDGTAFVKYL